MKFPILRIAWRNLFRNPRRTVVSVATVGFGSAGLLIFQAFNFGIMNQYRENTIRGIYSHGQVMSRGYFWKIPEEPYKLWVENQEEVEAVLKSLPRVVEVFPRQSFYAFVSQGQRSFAARGEGVLPERERTFFTQLNLIQGGDLESRGKVILGKGLAESLNIQVGDWVTILTQTVQGQLNGIDLEVQGIFHTGIKTFDDQFFRLHLEDSQTLLNTSRIEKWGIQLTDYQDWTSFQSWIQEKLPHLEAIPFEELDAAYYKNSVAFLERQFQIVRIIILIIVGLGIFNMVSMALLERSQEFGVLLANGESMSRLIFILMLESFFLGSLGAFAGIGLSLILDFLWLKQGIPMPPGPGVTRQFLIYLEYKPDHFLSSWFFPTVASLFASVLPANRVLSQPISQLLK